MNEPRDLNCLFRARISGTTATREPDAFASSCHAGEVF